MSEPLPAEAADTGAAATRWHLGEGFLLRVAGQPAEAVAALRTGGAVEWTGRVFALEEARDALAASLTGRIERAVAGRGGGDPCRTALINLRRDVFNGRAPRPATLAVAVPSLGPADAALLAEWTRARETLGAALAGGAEILAADVAAARAAARTLLAGDRLRCAVLLQSEVLERRMDRYLDPAGRLDKSARQIERTLLELFYRAALKTSPFSTLTSVGLGRFTPGAGRPVPEPRSLRQRSAVRLNVAVLARLSAVILADPRLRSELPVVLAPGAGTDGVRTRYVRRRTVSGVDPDAVVTLDGVHEDLFFLPSGTAVRDVVAIAGEGPISLRHLTRRVAEAGDDRTAEVVDQLTGNLLRLGLLVAPDLRIDLRSADPAAAFTSALAGRPDPVLRRVAASLGDVADRVARYPGTAARDRAALLAAIRQDLREVFALAGATDRLVPRTLVYEDATITGEGMATDRGVWTAEVLPSLAALAGILPAFDVSLPRRLTAVGFFRARFGAGGRCDDVERFCHEFQADFFTRYGGRARRRRAFTEDGDYVPLENFFALPGITALDRAREAAARHLRGLRPGGGTREEIRLGPEFVAAVRDALPPGGGFDQPWSFLLQLASADGRPQDARLVLNQAFSGLTMMFSRFAHSLDDGGDAARRLLAETLRRHTPPGAVFAELRGGYETTNLNVHPAVTGYEIVCPGDVSTRPLDERIPLDDLALVHDERADRLRLVSRRLDREVIPLYLGYLTPTALPEIHQVLVCFAPGGLARLDLWAGTGEPVPYGGVTSYPRLVLHDLVLQRRMWKVDPEAFPYRDPRDTDAEHLLRTHRWKREHGLPDRVFAQADPYDGGTAAERGDAARVAHRKPLPVDFQSWLSLGLLEQLARGASSRIVLTECSPDLGELWLRDEHGRAHVAEFLVELYDTNGGPDG